AEGRHPPHSLHSFLNTLDYPSCDTILEYFWHSTVGIGNDGSPAGHRLNHNQAKRLWPINGKEERIGLTQKGVLVVSPNLSYVFHQGILQKRLHHLPEVVAVSSVNLAGNLEWHAYLLGNGNGLFHPLLWRYAPQKRQVRARCLPEGIEVFGQ